MKHNACFMMLFAAAFLCGNGFAQYPGWSNSDSLFILTTPDGANLPAGVTETGFPVLVRLDKDFFTFSQAKTNGEDIRFSTMAGATLPYQLEEWDVFNGKAAIWVRIPTITGNARQGIKMFWGNPAAASESNGAAVFDTANGFEGVWHLNEAGSTTAGAYKDATANANNGTGASMTGASNITGMVGRAQAFNGTSSFIDCGDKTSQRISGNVSVSAWVNILGGEGQVLGSGGGWSDPGYSLFLLKNGTAYKTRIHTQRSGELVYSDNAFPSIGQWHLVGFTWSASDKTIRTYINGAQVSQTATFNGPLGMPLENTNIGRNQSHGFYFNGSIDEAVISSKTRSAAWMKLAYENQKPMQTLAGPLVPTGTTFSASQTQITVLEGKNATLTATAGGAQKIYWILKDTGAGVILAVDQLNYTYSAGRVTGDKNIVIQLKAVYPTEVKTQDITITVKEDQADPIFSLTAPATWNGRDPINVVAQVANQAALDAKGVGALSYAWNVANIAAGKQITPGKLTLTRSQGTGKMTVTLSINNGGMTVTHSADIVVTEPNVDSWVYRTPGAIEKPENNQFYARDDKNVCTVYYKGALTSTPDSVYLNVYAGATLFKRVAQKMSSGAYDFSPNIDPGLVEYKFEFGSKTSGTETVLSTVTNVLCGDAYIIEGQSNAVGTTFGTDLNPTTSEWVRTFGNSGDGNPGSGWANAVHAAGGGAATIGYWGLELGRQLAATYKIPICFFNGAVGGTRIDLHQRSLTNPTDSNTIYGRLLTRLQRAKMTHSIRGVLWHQGEADQNSDGPSGLWGWQTYLQYFVDMSSAWKEDYPNIKHYYIFQIWPNGCAQGGIGGQDNILREVQRTLPNLYSNMGIMSTIGVRPGVGCHTSADGYMQFVRLMSPLVERDNYGKVFTTSITPPNIKRAYYTSTGKTAITLEFDQAVKWTTSLISQFYLDGVSGKVASGAISGNTLTLALNAASTATKITYLDSRSWSEDNILYGANDIAALTFYDVPIYADATTETNPHISLHKEYGGISAKLINGGINLTFGRLEGQVLVVELINLRGQAVVRKVIAGAASDVGQLTLPGLDRGVYVVKIKRLGRTAFLKRVTVF